MVIIRNISRDIKEKIHNADKDIRKAIEFEYEYPNLSEIYYNFSVENLTQALDLHSEVVKIIEKYRKEEGNPSAIMQNLWDFEHKIAMEETENVKILQEYYKKL